MPKKEFEAEARTAANFLPRRPSPAQPAPSGRLTAAAAASAESQPRLPSALPPNAYVAATETGTPQMPDAETAGPAPTSWSMSSRRSTSNICPPIRPRAIRALHESLIDYGKNTMPEFITCMHEESSVAMGHGYFKATGKPLDDAVPRHGRPAACHHGDLQRLVRPRAGHRHRRQRSRRRPSGARRADLPFRAGHQCDRARLHQMGRQPVSAQHFAQSFVRVYKIAMTPPHEPVMISLDVGLQTGADPRPRRERSTSRNSSPTAPPQGD